MNAMKRIKKALVAYRKNVPHLPNDQRHWLANNSWRIDLIGAALSVFSIFVLIPLLFTVLALTPDVNSLIAPDVPYYHESLGLAWIALLATAIVFFITAVMLSVAVQPLREKRREGWNLMFKAYLLNVLLGIVTLIIVPSFYELAVVAFITVFSGYLLLEVRDDFNHTIHKSTKK